MKLLTPSHALLLALALALGAHAQEARVTVQADQTSHRLSLYLTGACIEDVNHEIYGGLYSQMLFGESFQEPVRVVAPKGFKAFGGTWRVRGEELLASGSAGDRLVSDLPAFANGEVGVGVFIPDRKLHNAGLIDRRGGAGCPPRLCRGAGTDVRSAPGDGAGGGVGGAGRGRL